MSIKIYSCFPKLENSQEWEKLILFVTSHYKDTLWKAISYEVNLRNLELYPRQHRNILCGLIKGEDLGFKENSANCFLF